MTSAKFPVDTVTATMRNSLKQNRGTLAFLRPLFAETGLRVLQILFFITALYHV